MHADERDGASRSPTISPCRNGTTVTTADPGHHHHKHPEPDAFMEYGRRTAFVVGMVHGVGAETPTQVLIFLTAVAAGGKLRRRGRARGTFLVGLLASNSMITLGSAFGFLRASQNWKIYVDGRGAHRRRSAW